MKTPYRMRLLRPVALLLLLTAVPALHAQNSNRNLLLNAASASQPRQISLGLPISGTFIRPFTVELTTRISF